jgi:hypothetical protein
MPSKSPLSQIQISSFKKSNSVSKFPIPFPNSA